jgi:hypothetical protein
MIFKADSSSKNILSPHKRLLIAALCEDCTLGGVDFWIFLDFQFPTVCNLWEKQF